MDRSYSCDEALEKVRSDLIDFSLRNRALNYRPLKSRGLELRETPLQDVYDHLVNQERGLTGSVKLFWLVRGEAMTVRYGRWFS